MTYSANVHAKARRLVDAGHVLELAANVYGVEGEHDTYLVALVPLNAARPVHGTGRVPPRASCTCVGFRTSPRDGDPCSHIVAAGIVEGDKPEAVAALFARLGAPADAS